MAQYLLVQEAKESNNKAKAHILSTRKLKTRLLRWEIPPPHLKLTLTSMEIKKNKNKRKGKTLPDRSIVVGVSWGHPMMLDHPPILAKF